MIYIILPAYNEEKTLPTLIYTLKEDMERACLEYRVVIVDDGSTDNTKEVVSEISNIMPIKLIQHPQNRGLAEALRTAFRSVIEEANPEDIIITMDADNTHAPSLIKTIVGMIKEGYDVVICSRYQKGAKVVGIPIMRVFLSLAASIIFRLLFPIKGVKDYTSGYRAYRIKVIKDMFNIYGSNFIRPSGRSFSCMADILLKIIRYPYIIGEVPIILRYDQKASASKMKVLKTAIETLKLIVENLKYK